MKRKKLNVIIPCVVYPFDIMFSFGETDEELRKQVERRGAKWSDGMKCTGKGLFYMSDNNESIVRLYNFPTTPTHYGTLQHEIFHAVTFIMDKVGMKFELLKSDEAYSYLIGYLTAEIYNQL